jgi:hypothetical protein
LVLANGLGARAGLMVDDGRHLAGCFAPCKHNTSITPALCQHTTSSVLAKIHKICCAPLIKLKIIKKVIPNGIADADLTQDIDNVQYIEHGCV